MSLFKSVSTVSLLTLASRITGLVRDVLMSSVFGVSALTDAFYIAFRIPNLFRRVLGEGAFSQAFVPVLAATRTESGASGARQLVDHVAALLGWTLALLCVAGVVAAPALMWLMASGLKHTGSFDAGVLMTRWMFPYIGFMSLVAFAGGILNTFRQFVVPAVSPVLLNVSLIASTVLGAPLLRRWGIEPIYAQCAGVMVGGLLQLAIQIPALRRLGMLPRLLAGPTALRRAWADPPTRKIVRLMLPALIGVSGAQLSLLINTQIASRLAPGSVSWITNADRLMEFPSALLGVALGVVLMPQLAAARAAQDQARYSAMLDWGLRLIVLLATPCALALLVFGQPLVAVLFHNGAFSALDVKRTTSALMGYGTGLLGIVAIKVLAAGFYARHDMKTPMRVSLATLALTQLLNLLFVPLMQHAGLTLSIGLAQLVNALALVWLLRRCGGFAPVPGWGRFLGQVALATAALAALLLWGATRIDWLAWQQARLGRAALLAAFVLAAALLYFGALALAGVRLRRLLRPSVAPDK